jgi:hypothetical protein
MITETEIRQKIFSLLNRSTTLAEFESWFVAQSWNLHKDSSAEAIDLASEVELLLAEFSNHEWTPQELLEKLRDVGSNFVFDVRLNGDHSFTRIRSPMRCATTVSVPVRAFVPVPA